MTSAALVVFAKEPRPGQVKTRLCPPFEPAQAARLYRCMLEDVLAESAKACESVGAALYLSVHPPVAVPALGQDDATTIIRRHRPICHAC